jgi:hemerythrin
VGPGKKLQAGSITVAAQLSAVLRDWLSLHIRRNDKELLRFQRRKAREQARASAGTKAPLLAPGSRRRRRPSPARRWRSR